MANAPNNLWRMPPMVRAVQLEQPRHHRQSIHRHRAGANTSASVAGSGTSGSFSPSTAGTGRTGTGVLTGNARAEAGRGMSNATRQTLAEAANGSRGTARNSPGGNTQSTGSAQGSNASNALAGSGARGSFSPSTAGSGRSGTGVMAGNARAEAGRGMSNATRQTLAEAANGSRGSARNNPGGSDLPNAGTAASANQSGAGAGSGQRGGVSPALPGGGARGRGVSTDGARSVAGQAWPAPTTRLWEQPRVILILSHPSVRFHAPQWRGARKQFQLRHKRVRGTRYFSPNAPSAIAGRTGAGQLGGAAGGPGMAEVGNVPSPRVTGSRLGGGAVNTDQVMRQIGSGSLAGPMRMMSSWVRGSYPHTGQLFRVHAGQRLALQIQPDLN